MKAGTGGPQEEGAASSEPRAGKECCTITTHHFYPQKNIAFKPPLDPFTKPRDTPDPVLGSDGEQLE